MAQNLDYRVPNSFCQDSLRDDSLYCVDEQVAGEKYEPIGRYYPWSVAMARPETECGFEHKCLGLTYPHQGVCPDGWHLPDTTEWDALISVMGKSDVAYWDKSVRLENRSATNQFGFSAIPTGFVVTDSTHIGTCKHIGDDRGFIPNYGGYSYCRLRDGTKNSTGFDAWTSTELEGSGPRNVYVFVFYADDQWHGKVTTETWYKTASRTVRCVKNESENDDQ
jgi:uncharacterized protein (TIGR02145 family)